MDEMKPGVAAIEQNACPPEGPTYCRRAPGNRCVDPHGKDTQPHAARWRLGVKYAEGYNSLVPQINTLTEQLATARAGAALVPALQQEVASLRTLIVELRATAAALTVERDELLVWKTTHPDPPPPPPTVPTVWDPTQFAFLPGRPSGPGYIRIEDIPGAGSDLRVAAAHQAADGKVITLPADTFTLNDYTQGDGGKFMHGLMVNSVVGQYHPRGIVGSGAGTVISMVPNSSHFTASDPVTGKGSTAYQSSGNQYLCSTIQSVGVQGVEFGNLTVQGAAQPHLHHGVRINSDNAHVHHLRMVGAGWGTFNMPPGETYPLMVSGANPLIEDVEIDGRLDGATPRSATAIGLLGCTNAVVQRSYVHDLTSGFGIVQWQGSGLTTEDVWVARPGSGTSGRNGCHTNHEVGGGPIRHLRPHIDIDGYWGPTDGRPRRNNSKFGHFAFLAATGGLTDTERYIDAQIIDPFYDSWGGLPGGFCILLDEVAIRASVKPKVIVNGVTRTGVVRPSWWLDTPTIDTATQYWIGANSGNGSLWG